jgi:hypothetical protein
MKVKDQMTRITLNFKTQMLLYVQPAVIWGKCASCHMVRLRVSYNYENKHLFPYTKFTNSLKYTQLHSLTQHLIITNWILKWTNFCVSYDLRFNLSFI